MFHPLHTDIKPPERFTYPFYYEPHPLCLLAANEVQQHLLTMPLTEGKMFGVLVVASPLTASIKPDRIIFGGPLGLMLPSYRNILKKRLAASLPANHTLPRLHVVLDS